MPSFCSYSSCGCCLWLNLINTISIQSLVITWYFPLNQGSFDQKSRLPWPFDPQTTNYLSLLEAGGIENQRTREPTVWVKSSDLMWQTSKSKLQHHDCPRRTNDTPVTHTKRKHEYCDCTIQRATPILPSGTGGVSPPLRGWILLPLIFSKAPLSPRKMQLPF